MQCLASRASERIKQACRPKTKASYVVMFRLFVAFCIIMKKPVNCVDLRVVLSYMECLACNQCSAAVIANHVSALKASFIVHSLRFQIFDHPQIKLFLKSVKINRPLSLQPQNIIDISSCPLPFVLIWPCRLYLHFMSFHLPHHYSSSKQCQAGFP